MDLTSKAFLGFLIDPLGRHPRSLTLQETGIAANGPGSSWIGYETLAARPRVRKDLLSCSLLLDLEGGRKLTLPAVDAAAARSFVEAAATAWTNFNRAKLENEDGTIRRIRHALDSLKTPDAYPSACYVEPLARDATDLTHRLLDKVNADAVGNEVMSRIAPITAFVSDPHSVRDAAIEAFVEAQLLRWQDFFDTVESMPLTPEQRLAVVTDEDATLVLAGAGSGKTSVITAKAAYLVKANIRKPSELLLLAFAKAAASEMSERIEARCGVSVEARTFHALAYDIIGQVEGEKPPLAPTATDDKAFLSLMKEILRHVVANASDIAETMVSWFSGFFDDFPTEWDFKTKHEWYAQIESRNLRTLQGETVNSFEELLIANWLFRNGVAYEYEPTYEYKLEKTGRRAYMPDFHLKESGVYIEHFGVRKIRGRDGVEELTTAPYIDRDDYLADMDWKRKVHAEHQTVLVETYSWEREEGKLLKRLAEKLEPHVTLEPLPDIAIYDRVAEVGLVDSFTTLVGTFLRHFKSGGYEIDDCANKAQTLKMGTRAEAFLKIFGAVLREYQSRLGERIDFEDMVNRATAAVESGDYKSPFRHILVDEFQDISTGRAKLIQALKRQHFDAKVFAVGDDWQSIYRFAGSDIHIMRNFGAEFGGTYAGLKTVHRLVDLGRTFRSVDKIALAARRFVLRNPAQINKTVIAAEETDEPSIRIAWTRRETRNQVMNNTIATLAATVVEGGGKPTILILGRYRTLRPDIRQLQRLHPEAIIDFKTIHASKGLEADHVIILGADNATKGFPSMIVDDPLLSLVSPESEPFPNSEERRVMYVALTRARRTVTILASEARPSVFVEELISDPEFGVAVPPEALRRTHMCPNCDGRLLHMAEKDKPDWYRCEHVKLCGSRMPACPACGIGLPILSENKEVLVCNDCGKTQQACGSCGKGWLVERRSPYGAFLGCVRWPDCKGKDKLRKNARRDA